MRLAAAVRTIAVAGAVTLAIVAPVAAFAVFASDAVDRDVERRAAEDRAEVAQLTAYLIDETLTDAAASLTLMAARSDVRAAVLGGDEAAIRGDLSELRASGEHSSATFIGPTGLIVARDPRAADSTGLDVSDRDYFTSAVARPAYHVSDAYLARGTDRSALVSVSLALRDGARVLGVLQVTFTPQQILSAIRPVRPVPGREILILDGRGRVIASTDPSHGPLALLPEVSALASGAGPRSGRAALFDGLRDHASTEVPTGAWTLHVLDDPALLASGRHLSADVTLAGGIAALTALVVGVAFALVYRALLRANDRVREQATTDELTGLHNRRSLETQIRILTAGATRSGHRYAVLAIDLDGLKRINDAFGHAAGDAALREFASTLVTILRRSDLAARVGGDEFAVLLPDTSLGEAAHAAERLLAGVARRHLHVPEITLNASVGVAEWRPGRSADDVLAEADKLLYAAKRAGRARLMREPDELPLRAASGTAG